MPKLIKNILVPTDFSENSRYALKAAVKFAQKIKGQIFLYHRINLPPNWDSATEEQKSFNHLAIKRDEKMKREFDRFIRPHISSGVKIHPIHLAGDLLRNTQELVEENDIDMVVMGSEGASGIKEWHIGSNAEKISDQVDVPVLIIKHEIGEFPLKQVVFASEFKEDAIKPFLELIELLQHFESTIHLLYICSIKEFVVNQEILDKMQEFKNLCSTLPCFIHGHAGHSVELGIKFFMKNMPTDLLCLVHHTKGPFERLFKGSISEKLINHLESPVLSFPADNKELEMN